jgi:hypothetical protein
MTYPINPTAIIIKEFVKTICDDLNEMYNAGMEVDIDDYSVIGKIQLSDGEFNDNYSFKTNRWVYAIKTPLPCGRYTHRCYIGYKHRDIDWSVGITESDEIVYSIDW